MSDAKTLYDEDFVLWSLQQAEALRAAGGGATNQPIDWENLAEEIEGLAAPEKRQLRSQMRRIVQHLVKLEFSPAEAPRRGWFESIVDARGEIDELLETSPSLKSEANAAVSLAARQGARKAIFELEEYKELDPSTLAQIQLKNYTAEQILGDWFPPEPVRGEEP